MRALLPCSVAAAIAEVGCAEACLVLLENPHAEIVPFSLDRIVDRHGHLAAIRDLLLARSDLPATTRQALVVKLSDTLAEFVTAREWLGADRARRVTREACERATVVLAAESPESEVRPLIRHLCESGQLNAGLILRSLLSGNVEFFEEALAELAGVPLARVAGIVHDRRGASFRALYDKAGLPASTFLAFREALEAIREDGFMAEPGGASRLKRRIIERALTRCENESAGRDRAAAHAAAPLCRRGRARGSADVLRRTRRPWPDRGRRRLASGRGITFRLIDKKRPPDVPSGGLALVRLTARMPVYSPGLSGGL